MEMTAEPMGQLDPLADEIDTPIVVQGARGTVERPDLIDALARASGEHAADLQAFAPEAVYGAAHLEAAARRALRAHEQDRAIARDLAVEVACYAAGTDQIDDALAAVGVPAEARAVAICSLGQAAEPALEQALAELGLERDDSVVQREEQALATIGVSEPMREHVPEDEWGDLAIEQVALLDAER
jgi:KEOPS complex subunit Cgi121